MTDNLKCPKCDRPYRCPRCNSDRIWLRGELYDKKRHICADCKIASYHCRECDKAIKARKQAERLAKENKPPKPRRKWRHGYF